MRGAVAHFELPPAPPMRHCGTWVRVLPLALDLGLRPL
jgi:hypothetical protein